MKIWYSKEKSFWLLTKWFTFHKQIQKLKLWEKLSCHSATVYTTKRLGFKLAKLNWKRLEKLTTQRIHKVHQKHYFYLFNWKVSTEMFNDKNSEKWKFSDSLCLVAAWFWFLTPPLLQDLYKKWINLSFLCSFERELPNLKKIYSLVRVLSFWVSKKNFFFTST